MEGPAAAGQRLSIEFGKDDRCSFPETLPSRITSEEMLDDVMTTPDEALIADLKTVDGDILILGVGGKMGPTLARLARRAAPGEAHHRRRALLQSGPAGGAGVARHRDDRLRPARPRGGRNAAEGEERHLHGRLQVRRSRQPVHDLGDERARPGLRRGGLQGEPHRRLLDRLRLSLRAGARAAARPRGPARSAGRICRLLPRPRAHVRIPLGALRHAGPAVPAELRHRPALRRAARHRAEGARRQAARRHDGSRQRHLAGRRLRAGAALPEALHDADLADQRQRTGDAFGARRWRKRSASGSAGSRSSPAWRRSAPGSPTRALATELFGKPQVPLSVMLDWVADWVAADRRSLGKPTKFEVRSGAY